MYTITKGTLPRYYTSTYCTVRRKRQISERIGNQGANQQEYAFCYFPYSIEEPQAPFQLGIFSFLKAFPHIGRSTTGSLSLGLPCNPGTVQTGISMNAEWLIRKRFQPLAKFRRPVR